VLTRGQFLRALAGLAAAPVIAQRPLPRRETRPQASALSGSQEEVTAYPPRPVAAARFGYNAEDTFPDPRLAPLLERSGAKFVRWQPGWSEVEDFQSGRLALGAPTERALARYASSGIQPVAVAAYGPPFANVLDLTVAGTADVPIGSYAIPVAGPLAAVVTPTDYVTLDGNAALPTARWAYYGSLIAATDTATGTITLASKTTVVLSPGQKLNVNRLRYAALADTSLTDPGVVAYLRYVRFLAERIAAHGASGYVCVWNEFPWAHDRWDSRAAFYDTVPAGVSTVSGLYAVLAGALTIDDLPRSVRLINGLSGKTGFEGVLSLPAHLPWATVATARTVRHNVVADGIHPYGNNPEADAWDPSSTANSTFPGKAYRDVNPLVDWSTNFPWMKYQEDQADIGLRMFATECGAVEENDARQAIYLLRRIASLWGMGVPPIVFAFAEGGGLAVVDYVRGKHPKPREAYWALRALGALVATLGGSGGRGDWVPRLAGHEGLSWPLMTVGVYGKRGSLLLAWQRTWALNPTPWSSIAPPAPGAASFALPRRLELAEVVIPRTGERPPHRVRGRRLVVPVGEDPIAIRCVRRRPHRS
jgi:hypothetical protein